MEDNIEKVDRISALPEPLLQHIMSFLPFKQIVETSTLSKTWERAWHTFPVLEFDRTFFKKDEPDSDDEKVIQMRREKFLILLNYMEETMRNRHKQISIKKFTLDLSNRYPSESDIEILQIIDRCVSYSIESNVKELKILFARFNMFYNLPTTVLCSKSIEVLDLRKCILHSPTSVKLSSLRKLNLQRVRAIDKVIENVVAGCPLIEDLNLEACEGFKDLNLFGLRRLNQITIMYNRELERVKMEALNVHSVCFIGLVKLCEMNMGHCKNLKVLNLQSVPITDEWLCNQISKLPLLEVLWLSFCFELESIKISSLCLKSLEIFSCDKLVEVKLDTPNLSIFQYTGDVISFYSDGLTLLRCDLCFTSENIDTQWYFKYVELLAKFVRFSKMLNLASEKGKNMIFPEELRQTIAPIFCGVKHFSFIISLTPMVVPVRKAVDGLLWISPHATTISIESDDVRRKFCFKFEFSYKKEPVYEGGIAQCCKSLPVSCWEKCIEEVKIEYTHKEQVKKYNFKGKDIWKKIDCLTELPTC